MFISKTKIFIFIAATILLYGATRIDFVQNDEYIHYNSLNNILLGNNLEPYLASTFYTQGFMAGAFAKVFGIANIPVLTALLAISCLYILILIVQKQLGKGEKLALLSGLILFINPIFVYSSLGFMSEIYSLFFLLLGVYSAYEFERISKSVHFALANLSFILGFFVKQMGIVAMVAWALVFLLNKKYRLFLAQCVLILSVLFYYLKYFPQTSQMTLSKPFLTNLLDFNHSFSLIYSIAIYLAIFTFPLIVTLVKKVSVYNILLFVVLLVISNFIFEPTNIRHFSIYENGSVDYKFGRSTFPYLTNIFTKNGFLSESLPGYKYSYFGASEVFYILEKLGKIFAVLAFVLLLKKRFYPVNYEEIYLFLYIIFLVISPKVYDRYLLQVIPLLIILLDRHIFDISRLGKMAFYLYIPFFAFLSYQFAQDFYYVNNYTWNRGQTLGVPLTKVKSENSWYHLYPNTENKWEYIFEYEGTEKQSINDKNYEIAEVYKIEYPLNMYINPQIYLVKHK